MGISDRSLVYMPTARTEVTLGPIMTRLQTNRGIPKAIDNDPLQALRASWEARGRQIDRLA